MGGGIGLHSDPLQRRGYNITIYDRSPKALKVAQKNNPHLSIKQGSFEEINIPKKYDAAISMWTTFTYILDKDKIRHFFNWISNNVKHLIILDQGNFYLYPKEFCKTYNHKIDDKKIEIIRSWTMGNNYLRTTKFQNRVTDPNGKTQVITDIEYMQFLEPKQIQRLLGNSWQLSKTYGDYNILKKYNKNSSPRMILKFIKNN